VSPYVAAALAQAEKTRGITELVAGMRAEDGPPDETDYAWALRALSRDGRVVTSDPDDLRSVDPSL